MKRRGLIVMMVVLACGFALPAGASNVNLKSKLVTLNQLPHGWLKASSSNNTELPGCKKSALPAKWTGQASVNFNFGALEAFPQLSEVLGAYKNVDSAFTTLTSGLSSCAHETASKDGKTFTVSITKATSSSYGDQSAAYRATIGPSIVVDVLVVRKGDVLMVLDYGNSNASVNQSAFQGFSREAVQKL
jgi:hypothetical protein